MTRKFLINAALAAFAVRTLALSPEHTEWGKGPAQFLMTKEETAQWQAITGDDQADRFVALFWARRDPTPDTPRNELREQFEVHVRRADTNFQESRTRGALTDRGKALILYGQPKKIERTGHQRRGASPPSGIGADPAGTQMPDTSETMVWTYEQDAARKNFDAPRAQIIFVDRRGNGEFRAERGGVNLAAAQQRAISAAITQPNLTEPRSFAAPAPQPAPQPAAPAAPAPQTDLANESLKTAVAEFRKAGKSPLHVATGEFVTAAGETFAPVLVYIPKAVAPGANSTFFGVVEDASGQNVFAFEEPARLTATKDDFFVDKSLTLPQGKYRGWFGVAEPGKPPVIVAADMDLTGAIDKDATAASQLILSNNVYPMTAAQLPTEPFAFGGLKVVPKANRTFRTSDELWYFVELRNPGLPEGAVMPKVQLKLDVEGVVDGTGKKTKMSAPPTEVDAIELKGVPGHFGIGSSILLATFKPGDYTFTVKILDTVKKTSYTQTEKFRIVE